MPPSKRPFLVLLLVVCRVATAFSQDDATIPTSSFGIGTGYAYAGLKTVKFSRLTQTGSGLPVQVFFRRSKPRNQLHFQLYYTSLSLTSDRAVLVQHERNGQFQFGDHFRLGTKERKITTWAGFVFDAQGAYRDFSSDLGSGTAVNNSSDEGFLSLNPSILFENIRGNDKLSLQIWAAIIAYALRSEDGTDAVKGEFVSVNKFSKTEARLSYTKFFSRHWEGRLDGQLQFYALSIDQTVYKINNQIVASIAYKL